MQARLTEEMMTQALAVRLPGRCHAPSLKGPGSKFLCFHTRSTMGMPSAHTHRPRHDTMHTPVLPQGTWACRATARRL